MKVFPGRLVSSSGSVPARTSLRAASSERRGSAGEKERARSSRRSPEDLGYLPLRDGVHLKGLDLVHRWSFIEDCPFSPVVSRWMATAQVWQLSIESSMTVPVLTKK